jgi:hypothetical protein
MAHFPERAKQLRNLEKSRKAADLDCRKFCIGGRFAEFFPRLSRLARPLL